VPRNRSPADARGASVDPYEPPEAVEARTIDHRYATAPSGIAVPPASNPSTATPRPAPGAAPRSPSASTRIVWAPARSPVNRRTARRATPPERSNTPALCPSISTRAMPRPGPATVCHVTERPANRAEATAPASSVLAYHPAEAARSRTRDHAHLVRTSD